MPTFYYSLIFDDFRIAQGEEAGDFANGNHKEA